MSISSSIYIGTTGIITQQESMSVISDNIANASTVGFKSSRILFQNLLSEQLTGATVGNQIGQGAGVSSVLYNMTPGSLESTNTSTNIAIGGNGFFMVSPEGSDSTYYTKAGNFIFDENGYLRDPNDNIVQGYKIATESVLDSDPIIPSAGSATLQDIQLDMESGGIVSEPEATTEMQMMINLDTDSEDQSTNANTPFTALFDNWDATQEEPLNAGAYSYESSLKIYDDTGATHTVTAYFDPAAEVTGETNGYRVWEFLVTVPPAEDASGLSAKQGVLMAGTLTFSPGGELYNMSAFSGTSDDKSTWTPVSLSEEGYPILNINLNGTTPIATSLNFGLSSSGGWNLPAGVTTMADLGAAYTDLPILDAVERSVLSTTSFNSGSSSIYQTQNGYPQGHLQSVSVDTSGTIIGNFSNGQDQSLYKIPLADFINPQGLYREGGNLFSSSKDSGTVSVGWAGEGRLGLIAPNSLEQSNTDLATEFVNMIITQRGFDANSKVITTADQVVQTALQLKK